MKYGSKIHFQKMLKKESHAKIGNILQFKLKLKLRFSQLVEKNLMTLPRDEITLARLLNNLITIVWNTNSRTALLIEIQGIS